MYPANAGELRALPWCLCLLPFLVGCPQFQADGFQKIDVESGSGGSGSAAHTNTENSVATSESSASVTATSGGSAGSGGSGGTSMAASVGGSDAGSTSTDSASSTAGGGSGGTSTTGCGNGVADPDEDCDGADLGGASCESEGLGTGELSCTEACVFKTTGCEPEADCGDDKVQEDEACDGTDLVSETCETQGFVGGELACSNACKFDVTGCTSAPACDFAASGDTGEVFSGNTSEHESRVDAHSCAAGGEGPDVSFTWTAPSTDCFRISVSSAINDLDTILSVYADCSLTEELDCIDDGGYDQFSELYFQATAGTEYAVVVDSFYNSDTGAVAVEITSCGGDWGSSGSGSGSGGPP